MDEVKIYIDYAARVVEVVGVCTILIGAGLSLSRFIFTYQGCRPRSYKILRHELGKSILLGLEILVAGDIISTVATEPTMDKVLILGVIVLIRTFLSLSLEVELEGKFPWQSGDRVKE
ncbi:DUF1622 domain-containing protein [soil metagenome]